MSLLKKLKHKRRSYETNKNSRVSIGEQRDVSGFAYLILPVDAQRESYIRSVYESGIAMLITSQNQVIKNAKIPKHILDELEFPVDIRDVGPLMHWVVVPKTNQIVVTGIHSKPSEFNLHNKENLHVRERKTKTYTISEIRNLGNTVNHSIIVSNRGNKDGGMFYKANSVQNSTSAHLKLLCDGTAEVYGDEISVLKSEKLIQVQVGSSEDEKSVLTIDKEGNFNYLDRHGNFITIEEGKMTIESPEILHGKEAAEAAALGDTLVDILDQILDGIVALTVPTAMGPSGVPNNIATFQQLKTQLKTILSTKNKIE